VLVAAGYDDALLLSHFGISVPDQAIITGLELKIRRATLGADAVDDRVQLLQDGVPAGAQRGSPDAWPTTLTYATYGGPGDLWGTAWTPAQIRSDTFGLSVSARYTGPTSGNERAYIDSVRATVFYQIGCE
jgi:hypothetical protein